MIKNFRVVALTIFLALTLISCDGQKGARKIWKEVLKRCAQSDVLGKNVLYFGPSLGQGPGSIWRKKKDGGYNIRWRFSNLGMPNNVVTIKEGDKSPPCQWESKRTSKITPSLDLKELVPVLELEAKADFQKAKKIEVKVDWYRWDSLIEGPFETAIKENLVNKSVLDDLINDDRFAVTKALFVYGLSAELEFDSNTAIGIKGKYEKGISVGADLKAEMKGDTMLKITSKTGFYIAAELTKIQLPTGFSESNKRIFGEKAKNLHKAIAGEDRL